MCVLLIMLTSDNDDVRADGEDAGAAVAAAAGCRILVMTTVTAQRISRSQNVDWNRNKTEANW